MVKKPLEQQIERIIESDPLPAGAADHLASFFDQLQFDEYPHFDLTDPAEAVKAAAFASEMLAKLQSKMAQIKALEQMLITRADEVEE